MRKNDAFVAKIVNTRLTKIFMAILAPDERLPSSATLMKSMNPVKPEDLMDPVSVVDVKHHVIVEPMDPKDLF